MPTPVNHSHRSTASGLAAILLWSTTFAFARSIAEQVGPITAGAAVYLVGGIFVLLPLYRAARPWVRWRRVSKKYLLGCGSLFVLYTVLIYAAVGLAQGRTQLLEIALVNYLWPSFTIVLALPLLGRRARLWLWPSTALALLGVFLVMTPDAGLSWSAFWEHLETNPLAYLCAFAAALAWALYSNLARRWTNPGEEGAVDVFIPVTGLVLLAMRATVKEPAVWTASVIVEVVMLGAITALAYALWDQAMRRGNLLLVVTCSYFTPLLSTLVSCAYLQVVPSTQLWIGCVVLVAGSLATHRSLVYSP